jgi:hypothetical protein
MIDKSPKDGGRRLHHQAIAIKWKSAEEPEQHHIDRAIHRRAKKMDPRVKPAGDEWINFIETALYL